MLRHFREQYQTDLVEGPLVLGGYVTGVLVKELKVCAFNTNEIFRKTLAFCLQVLIASNKHILIFRAHF